jgi:predicted nucleic acid-binding protein
VSGVLLDTNILIYSVDHRDAAKQLLAVDLVTACIRDGSGVVSPQVLQEFAAVSIGKLHRDLGVVSRQLLLLESLRIVQVTPGLIRCGLELCGQYQMNFWDATILAAAEHASCDRLWSEDFVTGATYGAVRIENPLVKP